MKKRYHGKGEYMMRARDGKAMKMHSAMSFSEGYYAGPDPRQRQELEDSRMIGEDHRAVANLPQEVHYHAWPHAMYAQYPYLDDSAIGIDEQIGKDLRGMRRHERAEKY